MAVSLLRLAGKLKSWPSEEVDGRRRKDEEDGEELEGATPGQAEDRVGQAYKGGGKMALGVVGLTQWRQSEEL